MTEKRFDVRILTVPTVTPAGEPFGIALARAFGVPLWQAEQIARDAPVLVKRGVTLEVAQKLQALLTSLGADAAIVGDLPVPVAVASPIAASAAPTVVGVPTISPVAPAQPSTPAPPPSAVASPEPDPPKPKVPSLPPLALPAVRTTMEPSETSVPSLNLPASRAPSAPPATKSVPAEALPPWLPRGEEMQLEPVAGATAAVPRPPRDDLAKGFLAPPIIGTPHAAALPLRPRVPPARATPGRQFAMTPGTIAIAALILAAVVGSAGVRWWTRAGDARLLGNTPSSETACKERYCLTGVGIDENKRGRRTIVVAWKSGCIDPNYRVFLEGLAEAHPTDLEVVGVALRVPETRDLRAAGMPVEPLPVSWPPSGCALHIDTLAPDRGYASDWLSPPVTYLSDADGKLMAVWREGMTQEQRDRLSTWLDGKTWESK